MKPSRLQNVLKSFGRAPKCSKILWPDPKIHEILENVGSGLPKIAKIYENKKNVIFRHKIVKILITGMERSILNTLWKKWNGSVLKFPRLVGIFESDLFWKWGTNLLFGKLGKNNSNMSNTLESRKLRKSIKINENK